MKHSMLWRSLLREIKGSLGRFLAIFAIVALGVGLFSGLKITKEDFLLSTTKYYRDTNFYDYRIVGELGFSDKEVALFAACKDVESAQGAYSCDAYYHQENGSVQVGRFHSLCDGVNEVILVEGRMPQAPDECLADAYQLGTGIVGKKITIGDETEEQKTEDLKFETYKVVGAIKSPLYIQFERGNTSLGKGTVQAFFYLPKGGFALEYYTEIYVKFQQDFLLYSKDYEDFMEEKEKEWTKLADKAGEMRFEELPELVARAEGKLFKKKAQARQELEEAKVALNDGLEKLINASSEIKKGKQALLDGMDELEQAKIDLENGKKEIEEKEPLLEKGKKDYEEGKKKIEDSEKLLTEKEQEYEAGKTQLDTARMTLQLGEMQYTLTLESQIQEQKTIDSENQALDTREQTLATREENAKRLGVYESYASEFEKERADIQKRRGALQAQTADLSKRYLENNDLGLQIANGKKEFEENEKKLEEGKKALEKGKEDLYQAKQQLLDAEKKIAQGEEELKEGNRKIEEGERQIEEGEKLIQEKSKELVEDDLKLAEAREEYLKGFGEFADGKKAYDEEVAKAEESIQKIKSRITDKEIPKSYLLGRDTNIGYMCFDSDASIVEGIANVFPVFFFLVAALICVTTMTRMVEEQRTQIGILKALGYSDGKIMFKFLFYSGSAAITGAIFGYFSGTHVFPYVIWTVYGIMYFAGPIAFSFNPMLATISLIVSLLCSVGATYLSCRKELGSNASVLMRPRSPKAGKRVFLEYVTFLWKRLSFLRKVAVRNVMRYKKRFIMMVLGIGGCTALLVTGFGLKDSIAGVAGMQYGEIQMMDVSVIMQNEIDAEFLEKLDKLKSKGVDEYLVYMEKNLDLVTDKGQKSVTVLAFPEKEMNTKFKDFYYLTDAKGTELKTPGLGEAIVTDKMAKILGIKVGAEITLQTSEMKEMRVTITGIAKNHLFNYVYMSDGTWENGLEEPCKPTSFCVKVAKDKDPGEVTTRIYKLDGVASVTITREVVTRFDTMMQSMNLIVILVTACAAGLAFIVLYNLTNINVTERIREIATIKVLGFFAGETALYVFRENFLLTILGAFVGLFMGKWLHAFVMSEINLEMVSFGTRILPTSYVYSVLLTILFSLLVSLIMNRRLEAISMTESLKSVD